MLQALRLSAISTLSTRVPTTCEGIGGDLWLSLYSWPPSETYQNGRNGTMTQELGSLCASCGFVATVWPFDILQPDRSKQPQLRASPGSGPHYIVWSVVCVRVRACVYVCARVCVCKSLCVCLRDCVWRIVMFRG